MNATEFEERTVLLAKDQPQYNPLPAHCDPRDPEGRITFCWSPSLRERLKILVTGRIWHQVLTFGGPLQPQLLLADKPELKPPATNTTPDQARRR